MGGRPTTLWVYLVPFGRYTWERACLKTAVIFGKKFFDHVTKPMVWGHNGYMGHTGTYFLLSLEMYIVVDISADKRDVQKKTC